MSVKQKIRRKLSAILSADVKEYSRLMNQDEKNTIRTLTIFKKVMSNLIKEYEGRVVDAPGDNLLAQFSSVVDAVNCAIEIQRDLGKKNSDLPPSRKMEFRIGVNIGDVVEEKGRIYGDGVNIAARIESLAKAGSVCLSGAVYDQIKNKLALNYKYSGEQRVKNIADPLRIYHVNIIDDPEGEDDEVPYTNREFSDRPAIAVLPFDNMSRDPDQEYFSDGLTEDLITRLSSWRMFPVIARNSTFVYKGKPVDIRQVSRELKARYIIEGSVRKAGKRIRATAQLIDADSGHHLWAESFDRDMQDIFSLQDEITEAIVGSMYPELQYFETKQAGSMEPRNIDAWERYHRGCWYFYKLTKENNARARSLFEEAITLDPEFAPSYSYLARTHQFDIIHRWTASIPTSLTESLQAAQRAVEIDPKEPQGQISLAFSCNLAGDRDRSISVIQLAVQLNPSCADAHANLAFYLALEGRASKALKSIETALHLSPRDPEIFIRLSIAALAHFSAQSYEEAITDAIQSLHHRHDWILSRAIIIASHAQLGHIANAKTALHELMQIDPTFSSEVFQTFQPIPELLERLLGGLKMAGLKE